MKIKMLRITKNMKDKYEKIQTCLFDLIPEKWEEIYLYASVVDIPRKRTNRRNVFLLSSERIIKKETSKCI